MLASTPPSSCGPSSRTYEAERHAGTPRAPGGKGSAIQTPSQGRRHGRMRALAREEAGTGLRRPMPEVGTDQTPTPRWAPERRGRRPENDRSRVRPEEGPERGHPGRRKPIGRRGRLHATGRWSGKGAPSDEDHGGPQAGIGSQRALVAVSVAGTDAKSWSSGGGTRRARRWSSSRGVRRSAWQPCRSGSGRAKMNALRNAPGLISTPWRSTSITFSGNWPVG